MMACKASPHRQLTLALTRILTLTRRTLTLTRTLALGLILTRTRAYYPCRDSTLIPTLALALTLTLTRTLALTSHLSPLTSYPHPLHYAGLAGMPYREFLWVELIDVAVASSYAPGQAF